MLTDFIVVIDVIASLALIVLVLLHSGKGGGLSDMLGGTMGLSASGSTVAEKNLDRLTIIFLEIFAIATIMLALRWN